MIFFPTNIQNPTYIPYKNRKIDFNHPVLVYRNLNNGLLSIKQNNLIVAHADLVYMVNCSFVVNQKGRLRVIKEKRKNVHAYVSGFLAKPNEFLGERLSTQISYNPYTHEYFKNKETNEKISVARFCYINAKGKIFIKKEIV